MQNENENKSAPAAENGCSEICFNVKKPKRGGGMITLVIVACVLLLAVGGTFAVIVLKSAIFTTDGGVSLVIGGKPSSDNPFDTPATSAPATTNYDISVQDPPSALSTTPVENQGELSIAEIADKVMPSVVSVLVSNRYESGLASGIIMEQNGYIITNNHVVEDMTSITVVLQSGEQYSAVVVGRDSGTDLAVIKIEASGLTAATFGNSDALAVGDIAVAIGTPYSLSLMGTTTAGIISAISRDIVIDNRTMTLIQTDATINKGNSGGPLVNKYGQVVGIISMKIGEDFEGLGFAIPMNTAASIINELINYGHVTGKPALGVSGQFLSEFRAKANNLPVGLYLLDVNTATDAYAKGLRAGDVITAIDGVKLTDLVAYNNIKDSHKAGDTITITVYRDENRFDQTAGSYFDLDVLLMEESES